MVWYLTLTSTPFPPSVGGKEMWRKAKLIDFAPLVLGRSQASTISSRAAVGDRV